MKRPIVCLLALFAVTPAALGAELLCVSESIPPGIDGRLLGHLPYTEVGPADLVPAPAGFALNGVCLLRRDAANDLARMLIAADSVPAVWGRLRAVSCFRSIARQRAVFCAQIGPHKRCRNAAERARAVGPPGFSEHATGYAIDFGTRPSPGCGDASACFAQTPAGRWLIDHAPDFGFELSFPAGNAQGVTWEPWHWRWVGTGIASPGAAVARSIFVRARQEFPAQPTTPDTAIRALIPPAIAMPMPAPTATPHIEVPSTIR
ncbi:MAG: hypothetical protein B7Y45_09990 [Sphingomonas sp. 28-66-16]|nr:MAG: hypothetical protein B7Y45_09990 [Sphingomonas sp. 28-66-16]